MEIIFSKSIPIVFLRCACALCWPVGRQIRVASLMALQLDRRKVADYGAKFSWSAATSQFLGAIKQIDREG